jgi:signal transduction histidine kinase
MKRGAETLRDHIGLKDEKKKKKYIFLKHDLGKILEKVLEQLRPAFLEKNIEIEYKKGEGNFNVEISQNDFERVITNLLHNARKYSYPGKSRFVKVIVKELGLINQLELSISSFGVPIKKEEIESKAIWEFGYRGELAYRYDREGTGVGLADAKEVIEVHKGEISLSSRPAKDDGSRPRYNVPYITTVTIRLPKSRSASQKGVING